LYGSAFTTGVSSGFPRGLRSILSARARRASRYPAPGFLFSFSGLLAAVANSVFVHTVWAAADLSRHGTAFAVVDSR